MMGGIQRAGGTIGPFLTLVVPLSRFARCAKMFVSGVTEVICRTIRWPPIAIDYRS